MRGLVQEALPFGPVGPDGPGIAGPPLRASTALKTASTRRLRERQRSTVYCPMCSGFHYRDVTSGEWARCVQCGVAHGGYCYPWHGARLEDWPDVDW